MFAAGVRMGIDMAILVHMGRCGLQGSTMRGLAEHFSQPYETARCAVDRLADMGLVVEVYRRNNAGRAFVWTVSAKGWELITTPGDFSMFPQALKPLIK